MGKKSFEIREKYQNWGQKLEENNIEKDQKMKLVKSFKFRRTYGIY